MTERTFKGRRIEVWPIGNLTPYETNVKKHERDQVARIAEAIQRHGFDVPIVVDQHGVIIKGHGRRLAAIELGMTHVDVIVRDDLTPDQVRAARLADNRVAQGDLDTEMLQAELLRIDEDLTGIFDAKELEFAKADLGDMNMDAFVSDMDQVVTDQRADMEARAETASTERVTLARAFGFKDVPANACIHITRLVAKAESATGLKEGEALAVYAASL